MKRAFGVGILVALICGNAALARAEDFPLRTKYPGVVPITTEELDQKFKESIIVDSRNTSEYKVIRIVGAKNILVGDMQESDLLALRDKTGAEPLVFYCNGITCAKSYKAAENAMKWGFASVYCYDAGIFNWADAHPERTELFGKILDQRQLQNALAHAKSDYGRSLVSTAEFLEKFSGGSYAVLDIRDPNERAEVPLRLAGVKALPIDDLVELIEAGSKDIPRARILFVDNVGKQGPWLNYYLRRYGFQDYFFLNGGMRQWKKDGYGPDGKKN